MGGPVRIQLQMLALACVMGLLAPMAMGKARHATLSTAPLANIWRAVPWRDLRVSLFCQEGNPAARICARQAAR